MNILEVLNDAIKPFLDGEKPPLNVGEVMNLWFYLTATEQTMRGEQTSFNIALDPELKEKLQQVINDVHRPIFEELIAFLNAEGVPFTEPSRDKPVGDFRSIPEGSRLSDEEIASLLSFNLVLGMNYACRGLTEAVRPDVAAMFAKFQMKKLTFAITFKDLLIRRGWLKTPPYFKSEAPVR
ncbi:hypothetical protein GCM10008018_29110 [Paenibacillus marchantiophytorum]|uniref:DUF3231 family protein n=1 Tax=Paenibacillus marchantiophytorum TaxID=1619310 RepID=A0ABQ1EQI2_9BACL|nr:DUF3231 family protein [Paenibacillus marchantiophytorum]GFZ81523.1 hypothetical protein GCM10008018_29110 [Paenibacillus marchantiophytorum]